MYLETISDNYMSMYIAFKIVGSGFKSMVLINRPFVLVQMSIASEALEKSQFGDLHILLQLYITIHSNSIKQY